MSNAEGRRQIAEVRSLKLEGEMMGKWDFHFSAKMSDEDAKRFKELFGLMDFRTGESSQRARMGFRERVVIDAKGCRECLGDELGVRSIEYSLN